MYIYDYQVSSTTLGPIFILPVCAPKNWQLRNRSTISTQRVSESSGRLPSSQKSTIPVELSSPESASGFATGWFWRCSSFENYLGEGPTGIISVNGTIAADPRSSTTYSCQVSPHINIGIPSARLTSTLVNLSITGARLTSINGTHDYPRHINVRFPPIWT